jgi:hypothetical protein
MQLSENTHHPGDTTRPGPARTMNRQPEPASPEERHHHYPSSGGPNKVGFSPTLVNPHHHFAAAAANGRLSRPVPGRCKPLPSVRSTFRMMAGPASGVSERHRSTH